MGDYNSSLELLKHLVGQFTITNSESIQFGIAGNYPVKLADVENEVVVFVLYYLEQKKCPHQLATFLAKRVAMELASSLQEDCGDAALPTAATLQMVVLDRLHKFCHHLIDQPEGLEQEISTSKPVQFTSVYAIKNKRRKMEDRHVVIHDLNALYNLKTDSSLSYYAVFDGHGGIDAASFTAAHLHVNIIQHPEFLSDTVKAIKDAYTITDSQFCQQASADSLKCGCTALSALIKDDVLYLAWLGDSQALLIKKGLPVTLMVPHTPDRKDERERIEGLGGFVCYLGTWRVNGTLAVSRALGDKEFKPFVSNEAEVKAIPLDGSEDFLILACDGLWDGMTEQDVSTTLLEALSDISDNYMCSIVAKKLVYKSKEQGSDDNITAIVVFLKKNAPCSLNAFKNSLKEPLVSDFEGMVYEDSSPENQASSEENSSLHSGMLQSLTKGFDLPVSYLPECDSANACSMPPEATILSELPTPPIDDILNEEYLYGQPCKQSNSLEDYFPNSSSCSSSGVYSSIANNGPFCNARDEALQIASSVVSSVVQSAIACVENMKISDFDEELKSNNVLENVSLDSETATYDRYAQEQICIASNDALPEKIVDFLPECSVEHVVSDDCLIKFETESPSLEETDVGKLIETAKLASETNLPVESDSGNETDVNPFPGNGPCPDLTIDLLNSCNSSNSQDVILLPENCIIDAELNTAANLVENVSSDCSPLNISSACEELPLASVAIDLTSVPVFVPEAEGVEDNDSDSEKDGGWSYVKAADNLAVEQVTEANLSGPDLVVKNAKLGLQEKLSASKQVSNTRAPLKNNAQISSAKQTNVKTPTFKGRVPAKVSVSKPRVIPSKASVEQTKNVPSKTATASSKPVPTAEVKPKKAVSRESTTRPISLVKKPSDPKIPKVAGASTSVPVQCQSSKPAQPKASVNTLRHIQSPSVTNKQNTLKPVATKTPAAKVAIKNQPDVSNNITKEAKNTLTKPVKNVPSLSAPKPGISRLKAAQPLSKSKTLTKPVSPALNNTTTGFKSSEGSKLVKSNLKKAQPIQKIGQSNSTTPLVKKKEAVKTMPASGRPLTKAASKSITPKPAAEPKSNQHTVVKASEPSPDAL